MSQLKAEHTIDYRRRRIVFGVFVIISVLVLSFVTWLVWPNPDAPSRPPLAPTHGAPLPERADRNKSLCERANDVPAYVVRFEDGSEAWVPPGRDQLYDSDIVPDGDLPPGTPRATVCAAIYGQYVHDRQYNSFRTVDLAKIVCEGLKGADARNCSTLAHRPPVVTPSTGTPAGYRLVRECRDQYRGAELSDCLTQE